MVFPRRRRVGRTTLVSTGCSRRGHTMLQKLILVVRKQLEQSLAISALSGDIRQMCGSLVPASTISQSRTSQHIFAHSSGARQPCGRFATTECVFAHHDACEICWAVGALSRAMRQTGGVVAGYLMEVSRRMRMIIGGGYLSAGAMRSYTCVRSSPARVFAHPTNTKRNHPPVLYPSMMSPCATNAGL